MRNFMKRRITLYVLLVGLFIVVSAGVTYSIFTVSTSQTGTNNISTISCIDITFENQSNNINLVNTYPMTDERGLKNTPYTFTLSNKCKAPMQITLGFEVLSGSTLSSNYVKTNFKTITGENNISLLSGYDSMTALNGGIAYKLMEDYLPVDGNKNYSLTLWLDNNTTTSEQNKLLKGKIIINTVVKVNGTEN